MRSEGPKITQIRKRDGALVAFDPARIERAIARAQEAVHKPPPGNASQLARQVVEDLERRVKGDATSVEEVQDVVEQTLIRAGQADVAKAYILYRQIHAEARLAKQLIGVTDDLKLSVNAVRVLAARYLRKDEHGRVAETPREMVTRVARAIAAPEDNYKGGNRGAAEEAFSGMMADFEFLPNSPTLMNAGTDLGQLSACFVLPVGDSLSDIFQALRYTAIIHQSGGGTGFSFSRLRPRGDTVRSTGGIASGPVSFMSVFDAATEVIKQGGRRRGANMGILHVTHPDVLEFSQAKATGGRFANFNLSVAATDAFMKAVKDGTDYELVNPRNGQTVRKLRARDVFEFVAAMAWRCGDPGLVFIDEINSHNPTPQIGSMESTNPCGEQPLLPYESCNLGSINVAGLVRSGEVDWEKLRRLVRHGVHFLDNVIDANRYPIEEVARITRANRKIGLGIMGFAELLIRLGIPYDSEEALNLAERLMRFIREESHRRSMELAAARGSFANFKGSLWEKRGYSGLRNATVTTIAPTGTISIIAGVSSGIEPLFAITYFRNVLGGARLLEENMLFEEAARQRGFYSRDLMSEVARRGSVREIEAVPEDVRRLFPTALDIDPIWHVRMQAAFQKYTDNAVSKTINLPADSTQADVQRAYLAAWEMKCKGITVFRYGSTGEQVLQTGTAASMAEPFEPEMVSVGPEYNGKGRACCT